MQRLGRHLGLFSTVLGLLAVDAAISFGQPPAPVAGLPAATAIPSQDVLTRGPLHEVFAAPVNLSGAIPPVVPRRPPQPLNESPADYRPDGEAAVWIPGYWAWDDVRGDFVWISGIWRNPPPGRQWVAGYWTQAAGSFQWTPGFWAAADTSEVQYFPQPPAPPEEAPPAEYALGRCLLVARLLCLARQSVRLDQRLLDHRATRLGLDADVLLLDAAGLRAGQRLLGLHAGPSRAGFCAAGHRAGRVWPRRLRLHAFGGHRPGHFHVLSLRPAGVLPLLLRRLLRRAIRPSGLLSVVSCGPRVIQLRSVVCLRPLVLRRAIRTGSKTWKRWHTYYRAHPEARPADDMAQQARFVAQRTGSADRRYLTIGQPLAKVVRDPEFPVHVTVLSAAERTRAVNVVHSHRDFQTQRSRVETGAVRTTGPGKAAPPRPIHAVAEPRTTPHPAGRDALHTGPVDRPGNSPPPPKKDFQPHKEPANVPHPEQRRPEPQPRPEQRPEQRRPEPQSRPEPARGIPQRRTLLRRRHERQEHNPPPAHGGEHDKK